jgi:2-amino-4-hydroxy-6-hydroxymethyldihydropteridine diphosphokinase
MTDTVFLGLGSNVDARVNIDSGISALRETFSNVILSPAYRTRAVGFEGEDFLNLAARVETQMSPLELKHWLHELEDRHGRERDVPKFSDRTLDIDILLFGDLHLISPLLDIPRAEILTAAHVLKPLADLAPDLIHPVECRTIGEIWDGFPGKEVELELIDL